MMNLKGNSQNGHQLLLNDSVSINIDTLSVPQFSPIVTDSGLLFSNKDANILLNYLKKYNEIKINNVYLWNLYKTCDKKQLKQKLIIEKDSSVIVSLRQNNSIIIEENIQLKKELKTQKFIVVVSISTTAIISSYLIYREIKK